VPGRRSATLAGDHDEEGRDVSVVDGKLVEHWAIRDDLAAMLQLGVVPPAARPPS
jgi:hypothetical protein